MTAAVSWYVGQMVEVQARTWAGINRPGGHGKITKLHCSEDGVVDSLDVKYTVSGGFDTSLDPDLVKIYEELDRSGRKRRSREVFTVSGNKENLKGKKAEKTKKTKRDSFSTPGTQQSDARKPSCKRIRKLTKTSKRKTLVPVPVTDDNSNTPHGKDPVPKSISFRPQPALIVSPLPLEGSDSLPQRTYMLSNSKQLQDESPISKLSVDSSGDGEADVQQTILRLSPRSRALPTTLRSNQNSRAEKVVAHPDKRPKLLIQRAANFSKPLRKVYDDQVQDAKKFVSELVQVNAEETFTKNSPTENPEKTEKRSLFFAKLTDLLQSNDGMVARDALLQEIQGVRPVERFSSAEVEEYIAALVDDNKVMQSDGLLFMI